ncbi:ABC transporter ATP-binding protein [Marinobacterium nitratireducens]|uniref:ABC-type dipeptide transporter n=1 Tax=Marinobacterium nitratireducens TaxID=518897 RepID=A0A917ZIT2_9GAMM|nr:ABC transporter ATP-binding protein [Marinobacterium nitratireducens]GGO84220.1 ABC transporter ATP-binding protein [Marinobacterium nitratireducens]
MQALLETRDLHVAFALEQSRAPVVRGVDFSIGRGEIVGLVGESGSGKSVTCMAAMGLLDEHAHLSGEVRWDGKPLSVQDDVCMSRLRGRELAMIFQDPMSALNPVQTIGKQLFEAIRLHSADRPGRRELAARAIALLRDVGVPAPEQRLKAYPHQLSGGLCQRVVIAMMLAGNPRLLIADEPTTALDVTVQAQIIELLRTIRDSRGMSIILVTHDLGVVAQTCDRVLVMYCGRVVESGPVATVFDSPRHPYTQGLLASLPRLDSQDRSLKPIPGLVPQPHQIGDGCAFAPRCPNAAGGCYSDSPPPQYGEQDQLFSCFYPISVQSSRATR